MHITVHSSTCNEKCVIVCYPECSSLNSYNYIIWMDSSTDIQTECSRTAILQATWWHNYNYAACQNGRIIFLGPFSVSSNTHSHTKYKFKLSFIYIYIVQTSVVLFFTETAAVQTIIHSHSGIKWGRRCTIYIAYIAWPVRYMPPLTCQRSNWLRKE